MRAAKPALMCTRTGSKSMNYIGPLDRFRPAGLRVGRTGVGRAVLLIHGWPNSSVIWKHQGLALLEAGYQVLWYDRRGFGESGHGLDVCLTAEIDSRADDLERVLRYLALEEVHVVAYADGCLDALRYLGNVGDERVRSLTLIAPPPLNSGCAALEELVENLWDSVVGCGGGANAARARIEQFVIERFAGADGIAPHQLLDDVRSTSPETLLEALKMWGVGFQDDLRRIAVDVRVIHGLDDDVFPPDTAGQALVDELGVESIRTVEGAGYGLCWTHAGRVSEELLSFLSANER